MRAVVQRVTEASVTVGESEVSHIGTGLLVFLGVEKGDAESDAEWLAEKIINLRIFEDDNYKMNLSLLDVGGELLVVSQFTLLADCRKGRRPGFDNAAEPDRANALYECFTCYANQKSKVKKGCFQQEMFVSLTNHGPVTILLDSKKLF